jgi:hypothetical protein
MILSAVLLSFSFYGHSNFCLCLVVWNGAATSATESLASFHDRCNVLFFVEGDVLVSGPQVRGCS